MEGSPYAAASARSPGGESVLFVASGASITGLRLPVPPLTSDAVAVETLQQPTPFTSFATSGEARGLHACGRYLFLADNAGLRYYDIASESNKLHALTEATLSLFEALGVSNLGRVTCIQSLPLSDTPDSLSNIVLFVVCDGKIAVVEAHPLSTPVAILLPLPSSSPSPLRVSFSPSPPSALFLACTDGEAVYRADLDVREIMECIQRGKATPAAVRSTPVRGSGGSRGGKKAAEKPKAPIPTLSITPEVYAQWAGPTGTPRDLLVTPDGLLFGCKNTPGGEGRVSVFGPEGSLPSLPFRAFSGATRVNTSSASPQRALMSPFRGLNTSAISTRSSPDQVTFAGDSLSVKHPPVGLHMQLMKALQCASKWEAEAHYLRAKERDSGGLLTVECDRLRVRLGESDL